MKETVRLQPGEQLSEVQTLRLLEAVAVLKAQKAALDAGVSGEKLKLYTWVVDVEPLHAQAV
jgi:hypothetical protein